MECGMKGSEAREQHKEARIRPDFSFGGRKNHEKYSAPASAPIKSSCEVIRAGGGFAAVKVNLR